MQVEAAEKRRLESENRGIKDPEKVRRMQERAAKMEAEELEAAKRGIGNPALKVSNSSIQVDFSTGYFISNTDNYNFFLSFQWQAD